MRWDIERWLAAMLAGGCLIAGWRRRSIAGWGLIACGGALAWWAALRPEVRQRYRGRLRAAPTTREREGDWVSEASEESFPASDAPAWTPTTGSAGRRS